MIFNVKYITRLNLPIAVLLSAVALGGWVPDFLAAGADVGALAATMVLALLNALGLMYLLYATNITRYREPLPVVLYLALTAAFTELHPLWEAQLAVTALICTVLILHHCYHRLDAQENAFLATALLLVGSLFVPELAWYIVVLWVALIFQQAFTIRSMLASLVAIGCFALYYAIVFYFVESWPQFELKMPGLPEFVRDNSTLPTFIEGAVCVAFGVWFSVSLLWRMYRESNRMRFLIVLHIFLLLIGAVWTLLPSGDSNGLGLMIYPLAMLATLFFRQKESVFRSIVFVAILALCVVAYAL